MLLAAVPLTSGSGAGKLQADNAANPHQIFRSTATVPQRAPFVKGVPKVLTDYGRLPLMFEPNQGQTDRRVKFVAHGGGYGLYLTAKEAVLALYSVAGSRHPTVQASAVSMNLVGASLPADPAGEIQLPGKSNYLIGNDPKKWHRDISQFARVRYSNVYPGIDVVYYGNQGRLEYDFEISPGSDPAQVTLRFQGTESPKIDSRGDLHLTAGGSDLRFEAPRVYQKVGTEERPVSGRFELRGQAKDEVGFQLGAYDRSDRKRPTENQLRLLPGHAIRSGRIPGAPRFRLSDIRAGPRSAGHFHPQSDEDRHGSRSSDSRYPE